MEIIKLKPNDSKLIEELSDKFPNIFLKNTIEDDFINNPYTNYCDDVVAVVDNKKVR